MPNLFLHVLVVAFPHVDEVVYFNLSLFPFYSASALLAMQSAVIAIAILSVSLSVTLRCFVQTNEHAVFSIW